MQILRILNECFLPAHIPYFLICAMLVCIWWMRFSSSPNVDNLDETGSGIRGVIQRFLHRTTSWSISKLRWYSMLTIWYMSTVLIGLTYRWQIHFVHDKMMAPYLIGPSLLMGLFGGWRAIPGFVAFYFAIAAIFYSLAFYPSGAFGPADHVFVRSLTVDVVRNHATTAFIWGVISAVVSEVGERIFARFSNILPAD